MHIEIGSFRLSWGARPASTGDVVEKALPPGARAVRTLEAEAAALGTGTLGGATPTTAPPTPGPLPAPPPPSVDQAPLRWAFPLGGNQALSPGRGKEAPFAILRRLARVSDVTRICIETRKDQLTSLAWDITPREQGRAPSDAGRTGRIAAARTFFQRPDRRRFFSDWLRLAIEDVLVVDALSIYKRRTRKGDLFALEVIDGTTILPLLDASGDIPVPPHVAYRQIVNGLPVAGGDCTTSELIYRPRVPSTAGPYGLSPTEAILLTINAALNRQTFNLQYYADGNIPRALVDAPETWTADQIRLFQGYFDEMLTGNLGARSRLRVVAHGMAKSFTPMIDPEFTTKWDEWLLRINCAAFAVPPQEIGFTMDVNRATGENQEHVVYRRGIKPLCHYFKELFDDVLATDLASPDLQFTWIGGEPENQKQQAEIDQIYLKRAVIGVDDVRARLGLAPIGMGPMLDTPQGPVFVDELLGAGATPDDDPSTTDRGRGGLADDDAPTPTGPAAEALETEAQKDLTRWQTVATKALKAGRRPTRPFHSRVLPAPTQHAIRVALAKAMTFADVALVFDGVRAAGRVLPVQPITKAAEHRVFTGHARVTQTRLQQHCATVFRAQGPVFADLAAAAVEEALS